MHLIKSGVNKIDLLGTGHYELIESIITDIFILPSDKAIAGSTSGAIGVLWFNPKLRYQINDIVEMIVHELTHQLMFVDELCSPHYNYSLLFEKGSWPVSAILNTPRPFDKVLHSAVVAMELLLLRHRYTGHAWQSAVHPPTEVLKNQLTKTIVSMQDVLSRDKGILKPRGLEIIDILKSNLESFFDH